jgi:hypothetical protein
MPFFTRFRRRLGHFLTRPAQVRPNDNALDLPFQLPPLELADSDVDLVETPTGHIENLYVL